MNLAFWKFVYQHLSVGKPVFLAFVAYNTRHSPGTAGASLAVTEDQSPFGTIGGGIMEADVLTLADHALKSEDFSPQVQTLHHRRKLPQGSTGALSGLGCAGAQTNVYYLARPKDDLKTVKEILDLISTDTSGKLTLSKTGLAIKEHSATALEPPLRFEDSDDWRLSALLFNWKRVAIFGGGHCGRALSRTMHQLGYAVTLIENRPDVFTFKDNPFVDHPITVQDYADAGPLLDHVPWTHVVVMTANIDDDIRALLGVAELPFPYIGLMGAPAKLARIRSELCQRGISENAIGRLYAPIGLPMTSDTPEEIAISVAAQILQERSKLFRNHLPKK